MTPGRRTAGAVLLLALVASAAVAGVATTYTFSGHVFGNVGGVRVEDVAKGINLWGADAMSWGASANVHLLTGTNTDMLGAFELVYSTASPPKFFFLNVDRDVSDVPGSVTAGPEGTYDSDLVGIWFSSEPPTEHTGIGFEWKDISAICPDLAVTSMTAWWEEQPVGGEDHTLVMIEATVQNLGPGSAPGCKLLFDVFEKDVQAYADAASASVSVQGPIAPGHTSKHSVEIDLGPSAAVAYPLLAIANVYGTVNQAGTKSYGFYGDCDGANESEAIYGVPSFPDLACPDPAIIDAFAVPSAKEPTHADGQCFDLYAVARNYGGATSTEKVRFWYSIAPGWEESDPLLYMKHVATTETVDFLPGQTQVVSVKGVELRDSQLYLMARVGDYYDRSYLVDQCSDARHDPNDFVFFRAPWGAEASGALSSLPDESLMWLRELHIEPDFDLAAAFMGSLLNAANLRIPRDPEPIDPDPFGALGQTLLDARRTAIRLDEDTGLLTVVLPLSSCSSIADARRIGSPIALVGTFENPGAGLGWPVGGEAVNTLYLVTFERQLAAEDVAGNTSHLPEGDGFWNSHWLLRWTPVGVDESMGIPSSVPIPGGDPADGSARPFFTLARSMDADSLAMVSPIQIPGPRGLNEVTPIQIPFPGTIWLNSFDYLSLDFIVPIPIPTPLLSVDGAGDWHLHPELVGMMPIPNPTPASEEEEGGEGLAGSVGPTGVRFVSPIQIPGPRGLCEVSPIQIPGPSGLRFVSPIQIPGKKTEIFAIDVNLDPCDPNVPSRGAWSNSAMTAVFYPSYTNMGFEERTGMVLGLTCDDPDMEGWQPGEHALYTAIPGLTATYEPVPTTDLPSPCPGGWHGSVEVDEDDPAYETTSEPTATTVLPTIPISSGSCEGDYRTTHTATLQGDFVVRATHQLGIAGVDVYAYELTNIDHPGIAEFWIPTDGLVETSLSASSPCWMGNRIGDYWVWEADASATCGEGSLLPGNTVTFAVEVASPTTVQEAEGLASQLYAPSPEYVFATCSPRAHWETAPREPSDPVLPPTEPLPLVSDCSAPCTTATGYSTATNATYSLQQCSQANVLGVDVYTYELTNKGPDELCAFRIPSNGLTAVNHYVYGTRAECWMWDTSDPNCWEWDCATTTPSCGTGLSAGETVTFVVEVATPSTEGAVSATLCGCAQGKFVFAACDPVPTCGPIAGASSGPAAPSSPPPQAPPPTTSCSVNPTSIACGSVEEGDSGPWKSFTIDNTGDTTISGSITLTGSHSSQFELKTGSTSYNLTSGASKTCYVRFTPSSAGSKSATVQVGGTGGPCSNVSVSGTGTAPPPPTYPDLDITGLDACWYCDAEEQIYIQADITVKNKGDATATDVWVSVSVEDSCDTVVWPQWISVGTLTPGQSKTVQYDDWACDTDVCECFGILVTVEVSCTETEPNTANNDASVVVQHGTGGCD